MTNEIYVREPTQRYEVYEVEENKRYFVVDFHKPMRLMGNGLPSNGSIHYIDSPEHKKEFLRTLCDKNQFETYKIFPATLDEIKTLYADINPNVVFNMTFLCDTCTEIKECPRFSEVQRYVSLYNRDRIFSDYSYYRGLAFHATALNCRDYKNGVIPRGRGFTVEVKRCNDCPWYREEQIPDDNSDHYCEAANTYIQVRRDTIGGEINYIPNWCPKLPENVRSQHGTH